MAYWKRSVGKQIVVQPASSAAVIVPGALGGAQPSHVILDVSGFFR